MNDQQLLEAFYSSMHSQVVADLTLQQLVAADDSVIPAAHLRESFQTSKRGPAVFMIKTKPWLNRVVTPAMVHTVNRIAEFALHVDPDHEACSLLKLNFMRLGLACYQRDPTQRLFEPSSILANAPSISAWRHVVLGTGIPDERREEYDAALCRSLKSSLLKLYRREQRTSRQLSEDQSANFEIGLLLDATLKRDLKSFWTLLSVMDYLIQEEERQKDLLRHPMSSSVFRTVDSRILQSFSEEPPETLAYIAMERYCSLLQGNSARELRKTVRLCMETLPAEVAEDLVAMLCKYVLLWRASRLAQAAAVDATGPLAPICQKSN